jgi:hypothetical protein
LLLKANYDRIANIMTIERLHSEDGYPLDLGKSPMEQIAKILVDHRAQVQALPEGEYNLTPKWWTKHLMEHKLKVLENGSGIYHSVPRESGVGTIDFSQRGPNQYKPGGNVSYLPQDNEIAVVGGPLKDRKTMGVYEIIVYTPGPSPKK